MLMRDKIFMHSFCEEEYVCLSVLFCELLYSSLIVRFIAVV